MKYVPPIHYDFYNSIPHELTTDVTFTQQNTDTELAKLRTDKAAGRDGLSPRLLLEIERSH